MIAGRADFVFPPACQEELASGISDARLVLVDEAGHNPQDERPRETLTAVRSFLDGPAEGDRVV